MFIHSRNNYSYFQQNVCFAIIMDACLQMHHEGNLSLIDLDFHHFLLLINCSSEANFSANVK